MTQLAFLSPSLRPPVVVLSPPPCTLCRIRGTSGLPARPSHELYGWGSGQRVSASAIYTYVDKGTYEVTVAVNWSGSYTFDKGAPIALPRGF